MGFVVIQFSILFYMGFNIYGIKFNYASLILFCISFALGLWAIFSMGIKNLSVFPDPKSNGIMKTSGPYRWIRHPMYTAVLVFSTAMFLMNPVWNMFYALLILVIDLILKLRHEEKLLMHKFENYNAYKKSTYYLIPYIY
jgi:protein-S-isoprenylcysteine O-methyltransferase Ste14